MAQAQLNDTQVQEVSQLYCDEVLDPDLENEILSREAVKRAAEHEALEQEYAREAAFGRQSDPVCPPAPKKRKLAGRRVKQERLLPYPAHRLMRCLKHSASRDILVVINALNLLEADCENYNLKYELNKIIVDLYCIHDAMPVNVEH